MAEPKYQTYPLANIDNLISLMEEAPSAIKFSRFQTKKQKRKLASEMTKRFEKLEEKAKERAKKKKKWWKPLNIIGMLTGPYGALITGALTGGSKARQQRKGAKELLLSEAYQDKLKRIFLAPQGKAYQTAAEKVQLGKMHDIMGGLKGGITAYATSRLLGGEPGGGSGFFEGMFKPEAIPSEQVLSQALPEGTRIATNEALANEALLGGTTFVEAKPMQKFMQNIGKSFSPKEMMKRADKGLLPDFLQNLMDKKDEGGLKQLMALISLYGMQDF